jgi:hypothetical protein
MLEDKFKRYKFPFGKKFKFQMDFELYIPGKIPNWRLVSILKGFKRFGKNPINSPKIFLGLIFNNVNLG